MKRAVELGHTTYFTTNHGCSSNVLEAYGLCKKYGLKLIHGIEMYYADDRFIKDGRNNSHIVVIGLTKNAYKHINRISSEANKTGFYYHPRVDMELLLSLPPREIVITTACIGGRLFKTENYIDEFVKPLKKHFGENFMLETQNHPHVKQVEWNKKVIDLSRQYDIPIGAYYYVGRLCTSYADGVADAERFMKIISGITFEYPVFIDLESTSPKHIAGATEACKGFCNTLEKAGYYAGIYASDVSGFKDRLYLHELDRFDKWVARYGSQPKVCRDYGIWQYSSSGMLDGIAGKVDLDYSYKSYPEIMKRAHLNGF